MPLETIDIIVPSFNNGQYLIPMLYSVLLHRLNYPIRILVINNGHPGIKRSIPRSDEIEFLQAPENLGWEGGLKLGLEKSDSKFVMFANDDIFVPFSSGNWIRFMMTYFQAARVAAVGPMSNCVMGAQNMWAELNGPYYVVPYLIGFCMLLRREALDKAGGVLQDLPGGDDIDLSIRLNKLGYELVLDRRTFVYHHGFKTGERVHGGPNQVGGWNSKTRMEQTNHALIRRHGLKKWHETLSGQPRPPYYNCEDQEAEIIKSVAVDGSKLELGCGGKKTFSESVGVDYYGNGELIPTIGVKSVADIKSGVEKLPENLPKFMNVIARHILEHLVDPLQSLGHWRERIEPGGKLILALPDERLCDTIPLNAEHKHAFTPDSISSLLDASGYQNVVVHETGNGVSMVVEAVNAARVLSSSLSIPP